MLKVELINITTISPLDSFWKRGWGTQRCPIQTLTEIIGFGHVVTVTLASMFQIDVRHSNTFAWIWGSLILLTLPRMPSILRHRTTATTGLHPSLLPPAITLVSSSTWASSPKSGSRSCSRTSSSEWDGDGEDDLEPEPKSSGVSTTKMRYN